MKVLRIDPTSYVSHNYEKQIELSRTNMKKIYGASTTKFFELSQKTDKTF